MLLTACLAGTLGTALAQAPAQASTLWQGASTVESRVCGDTQVYSGIYHQVCLEYTSGRTQVRAAGFVYASSASYFQANVTLAKGGGQGSWSSSCPTLHLTSAAQLVCATSWQSATTPYYLADATFGVAGTWRPPLRAIDTPLIGKRQETSSYCGPAAVQTVLATMRRSVPSQATLASELGTGPAGTLPWSLPASLNSRLAASDSAHYVHYLADVSVYPGEVMSADNIYTSLARGKPVIVLVTTARLPWWSNTGNIFVKHYVVVTGVAGVYDTSVLDYVTHPYTLQNANVWDPADGKEHTISLDTLLTVSAYNALPDDSAHIVSTPTS